MAEETTERIITVQAKYESLALMKEELTALKKVQQEWEATLKDTEDALQKGESTYEDLHAAQVEYEKSTVQLKAAQTDYNNAVRISVKDNLAVKDSMNALQAELGTLKEAWKNVAVGSDEYKALTERVNEVKAKINEANHEIGNYQDQVGQYAQGMGQALNVYGEGLEKARAANTSLAGAVKNTGSALKLMSTNPIFALVQLTLPLLMKIGTALKDNTTVIEAGKKALTALQPILDTCTAVIETLAGWIDKAATSFVDLAASGNETFSEIISGAVGVGNVLLQSLLSPIRSAIDAFKGLGTVIKDVFKGDFDAVKADTLEAGKGIKDAFVKGFDIKGNFDAGKQMGAQFLAGLSSKAKSSAADAGAEAGQAFSKAFSENIQIDDEPIEIEDNLQAFIKAEEEKTKAAKRARDTRYNLEAESLDRQLKLQIDANNLAKQTEQERADAEYSILQESSQRKVELLRQYAAESLKAGDVGASLSYQQKAADTEYDIWHRAKVKEITDAQQMDTRRMKIAQATVSSIVSILGTVASAYQSQIQAQVQAGKISEEEAEKQFKSVKALQYATTWISTLASVAQIMADTSIPSYWIKVPLAAAQLATGIAQTISIKNTELGSTTTDTASVTPTASVSQSSQYTPYSTGNVSTTNQSAGDIAIGTSQSSNTPDVNVNVDVNVNIPEIAAPSVSVNTPKQDTPSVTVNSQPPDVYVTTPNQETPNVNVTAETPAVNVMPWDVDFSKLNFRWQIPDIVPAAAPAPVVNFTMPETKVVTDTKDEEMLRRILSDQRVYVVMSDINEAGRKVQVLNNESSF